MNPWIPTVLNFFFPGLGYLVAGHKRELAILWLIGVIGLTIVEFGIRDPEPGFYWLMFVSVFIMNTAFAIDVYRAQRAAVVTP